MRLIFITASGKYCFVFLSFFSFISFLFLSSFLSFLFFSFVLSLSFFFCQV
jgi:hypothetical protein